MGSNTTSFIRSIAVIPAKASTCMFSIRWILFMAHLLNLSKVFRTFERYWTMRLSLASYLPWICPTTCWESLHISSLEVYKVRARLNLARMASYLASLVEVGNPSRIACSNCSLVGDYKGRPILDPKGRDTPSKCSIYHPFLREFAHLWSFWGVSAMKSVMIYPFIASLGWYLILYSLSSMAYLSILSYRSGLCRMPLSGWFVSTVTWCAWI